MGWAGLRFEWGGMQGMKWEGGWARKEVCRWDVDGWDGTDGMGGGGDTGDGDVGWGCWRWGLDGTVRGFGLGPAELADVGLDIADAEMPCRPDVAVSSPWDGYGMRWGGDEDAMVW